MLLKRDFYCTRCLKIRKKDYCIYVCFLLISILFRGIIKNDGNKVRLVCSRNNTVMKQGNDYGLLPYRRFNTAKSNVDDKKIIKRIIHCNTENSHTRIYSRDQSLQVSFFFFCSLTKLLINNFKYL